MLDNEIIIGVTAYNAIFGTKYVTDKESPLYYGSVSPHTIKINRYRDNDKTKELEDRADECETSWYSCCHDSINLISPKEYEKAFQKSKSI